MNHSDWSYELCWPYVLFVYWHCTIKLIKHFVKCVCPTLSNALILGMRCICLLLLQPLLSSSKINKIHSYEWRRNTLIERMNIFKKVMKWNEMKKKHTDKWIDCSPIRISRSLFIFFCVCTWIEHKINKRAFVCGDAG